MHIIKEGKLITWPTRILKEIYQIASGLMRTTYVLWLLAKTCFWNVCFCIKENAERNRLGYEREQRVETCASLWPQVTHHFTFVLSIWLQSWPGSIFNNFNSGIFLFSTGPPNLTIATVFLTISKDINTLPDLSLWLYIVGIELLSFPYEEKRRYVVPHVLLFWCFVLIMLPLSILCFPYKVLNLFGELGFWSYIIILTLIGKWSLTKPWLGRHITLFWTRIN